MSGVSTAPAEPDISPVPDLAGHFGAYGGLFAPESLMAAIEQLAKEYEAARTDPHFTAELNGLLTGYAARPTLLTEAKRFGAEVAGGGGGHPVLAGAGLRDHPGLAHPLGEQHLAEHVVDLV